MTGSGSILETGDAVLMLQVESIMIGCIGIKRRIALAWIEWRSLKTGYTLAAF